MTDVWSTFPDSALLRALSHPNFEILKQHLAHCQPVGRIFCREDRQLLQPFMRAVYHNSKNSAMMSWRTLHIMLHGVRGLPDSMKPNEAEKPGSRLHVIRTIEFAGQLHELRVYIMQTYTISCRRTRYQLAHFDEHVTR